MQAAHFALPMLYMTGRASAINFTSAAATAPHQATVQLLMPALVMHAVQLVTPMRQATLQLGLHRAGVRGPVLPSTNRISETTLEVELSADASLQLPYRASDDLA